MVPAACPIRRSAMGLLASTFEGSNSSGFWGLTRASGRPIVQAAPDYSRPPEPTFQQVRRQVRGSDQVLLKAHISPYKRGVTGSIPSCAHQAKLARQDLYRSLGGSLTATVPGVRGRRRGRVRGLPARTPSRTPKSLLDLNRRVRQSCDARTTSRGTGCQAPSEEPARSLPHSRQRVAGSLAT